MTYIEIAELLDALIKLGERDLPIAYEIAKNIRACKVLVREGQEIAQELFNKFADKNPEGKFISYTEGDKQGYRITDGTKMDLYRAEIKKLEQQEHDLKLIPIPKTSISGKDLPANLLVPLIGTVILD